MYLSKSATSVMMSCSAEGQFLPLYVVYKAEHVYDTWIVGGPPNTRYNRSKNGWFDSVIFQDWFTTVALPYFKKQPDAEPKAIIGDNMASHVTTTVIDMCEKHKISSYSYHQTARN